MTFKKAVLIGIGGGILLIYLGYVFVPDNPPPRDPKDLPWQISATGDGSITVFGLTLGETTLGEAVAKLGNRHELGLFRDPDGKLTLEAFFKDIRLSGLTARVVLTGDADPETLETMLVNSDTGKRLANGIQQFPVTATDLPTALAVPVRTITYVPYINLNEDLVRQSFGEPAERIPEPDSTVVHWLYPDKGLDLMLDAEGKAILQYVAPKHFEQVRTPLLTTDQEG